VCEEVQARTSLETGSGLYVNFSKNRMNIDYENESNHSTSITMCSCVDRDLQARRMLSMRHSRLQFHVQPSALLPQIAVLQA
jgi:hypothetical protein